MNDAPILSDDDPYSMPSMPTMRGGDPDTLGRIDHYDLLRKLGGGGFGVVYLARDSVSGIEVAIKTLHPLLKRNAEEMDMLREKFRLVHGLTHPNIAKALVLHLVREVGIRDDSARSELRLASGDSVMVMDYAPGVTLSKWRRQFPNGVVPPDLALEIGRQVASALDYAHGERIVHRDIKPGNIMVETVEGGGIRVRILDFGLAAEIRSSMSRVSTEQGDTSGTRPYMAPEQWLGKKQDGQTDQYALACVLYELLSGAPPFAGVFETGDPAVIERVVTGRMPDRIPGLSPSANAALLRALAKDPAARFPSCAAFVGALEGKDGGSRTAGRRRALASAAAALGALAVVASGALLVARSGGGSEAGADSHAEPDSRAESVERAGQDSHAKPAEFAEPDSRVESAEPDSRAESAERAGQDSRAEPDSRAEEAKGAPGEILLAGGAKLESHAEDEDGDIAKSPEGPLSAERPPPPVPKPRQTIVKSTKKAAKPLLVVNATLDGKPVSSGAKLVVRGKSYELNRPIDCSTVSAFGPGEVSLERDGKAFVGSFPRMAVSWSGRKPVSVRLAEWKEHPPAARTTVHVDDVEIALRWCPAGSFRMGSPDGDSRADKDERPQISVDVPRGFWMGETEVTQALWRKFMKDAPPNGYKGDEYPMEFMSWTDCVTIVAKLNEHPAVKEAGLRFAIPTEAQWEYACRAGGTGDYGRTKDGEEEDLGPLGWYDRNSGSSIMPVARKEPNAWGIHDMHGNVCEWCANVYSGHPDGTLDNVWATEAAGDYRVLRGGNYSNRPQSCRAADRSAALPNHRLRHRGFRLLAFPNGR